MFAVCQVLKILRHFTLSIFYSYFISEKIEDQSGEVTCLDHMTRNSGWDADLRCRLRYIMIFPGYDAEWRAGKECFPSSLWARQCEGRMEILGEKNNISSKRRKHRLPREGSGLTKWDVRKITAKTTATWENLAKSVREIYPVWKILRAAGDQGHLFKKYSSVLIASWGYIK